MKSEIGSSLVETLVAMALLGIIGVAFLSALSTSSSTRVIADEHASGKILAESQMENIKQQSYASSYDPVPIPADYAGYSAAIDVDNIRNGHIQKVTVTVSHHNKDITSLETYKVNR
jgi:type II secretory pathway pseudopilin PulG